MARDDQINFLKAQMKNLETEFRLKKEENQQDWETKFKNLNFAFHKNLDELLAARNELAKLQNFRQFMEKQQGEAVQLYSKEKTEEVENDSNLENSVNQQKEDLKRQEEIIRKQQIEIKNLTNAL